jgi:hypothetical protein
VIALARRTAVAAIVILAACLGACGGEEAFPQADSPAALAPAGAPIYVEATVQPEQRQRRAVSALLDRFPGGDQLIDGLVERVDSSLAGHRNHGDEFTFADDVRPWLGSSVGFFTLKGGSGAAAGVFAVDDPAAATEVARNQPQRGGGRTQSVHFYRGVLYAVDGQGQTSAYVDGFLVAGDEAAVRAAIDVARGDQDSLESTGALDAIRDQAGPAGPLALARVELDALSRAVSLPRESLPARGSRSGGTAELTGLTAGPEVSTGLDGTLTAALAVRRGAATLDLVTRLGPGLGATAATAGSAGPATKALRSLPAGSFVAAAAAGFGTQFGAGLEQGLQAQLGPFVDPRAFRRGLRQRLGFDPVAVARSFGDLGFFVEASSGSPQGAVVVDVKRLGPVTDALDALPLLVAAQRSLRVDALPNGLPQSPRGFLLRSPHAGEPIVVALAGKRLILAYGTRAASRAIAPSRTLADAKLLRSARHALGGKLEPSVVIDVPGLTSALEGVGPRDRRGLGRALPYLKPLDLVVAGSRMVGERIETRLVATLGP